MDKEIEESTELEIAKIQSAALANHPGTQTDFLQTLFAEEDEESDEPMDEAHIVWTTPQAEEELEELNRYLDSI